MIVFQKVRWKNFLSTGDNFTEIQLNRSPSTLIVGQNGAGKSTLLDALSFSLFGKPHRDINKPQLINSINNKNCVVEVEFAVGRHEFKIIRGIKPNQFEIYQNGSMINQEANARDYQKYLEQNIIKLNHKSFHQIVVLGSSSFIPFMQLPGGHRREVIEDLLDIGVFSKMNGLLRERAMGMKEQLKDMNFSLEIIKEKIILQRRYIRDITEISTGIIKEKTGQILGFQSEIVQLQEENSVTSTFIEERQHGLQTEIKKSHDKRQGYSTSRLSSKSKLGQSLKTRSFMKIMKHAQYVPKVLIRRLGPKNSKGQRQEPRSLTRGYHMPLKSQLLWNRLLNGSMALQSRLEKQPLIYLLTIKQSYGCKDKYVISKMT